MEYFIGTLVIIWILYILHQGYAREMRPPLTLRDTGNGIKEPVCSRCQTRLVAVNRSKSNWAADVFSVLFGLVGVVLILFNWIVGGIILILAVIIALSGKGRITVLICPACGTTERRLD